MPSFSGGRACCTFPRLRLHAILSSVRNGVAEPFLLRVGLRTLVFHRPVRPPSCRSPFSIVRPAAIACHRQQLACARSHVVRDVSAGLVGDKAASAVTFARTLTFLFSCPESSPPSVQYTLDPSSALLAYFTATKH